MLRRLLLLIAFATSAHASISGAWIASRSGNEVNFRLMQDRDNYGFTVDVSALTGSGPEFQLIRPAGTFDFKGSLDGWRGSGSFTFMRNDAFTGELGKLGYASPKDDTMMLFATTNLTTQWVRE